jgi:hypothetical protein
MRLDDRHRNGLSGRLGNGCNLWITLALERDARIVYSLYTIIDRSFWNPERLLHVNMLRNMYFQSIDATLPIWPR